MDSLRSEATKPTASETSLEVLDRIVADACRELVDRHAADWSSWEIGNGLKDLLELNDGRDCCYDRPSIGVSYALWYHVRRTHDALAFVLPLLSRLSGDLRIIDLGCGTGATATAAALMAFDGQLAARRVTVEGIDSSAAMLETGTAIHQHLDKALGTSVEAKFELKSWDELRPEPADKTILVGGYLLDRSDFDRRDEIARRISRLSDTLDAAGAVLTTAPSKQQDLIHLRTKLIEEDWTVIEPTRPVNNWSVRKLHECAIARHQIYADCVGLDPKAVRLAPFSRAKSSPELLAIRRPRGRAGATLFDLRSGRLHDPEQIAAASPEGGLTIIVGAAGSGKSMVLAERIAATVDQQVAAGKLSTKILVTAFNKGVIDQLAAWTKESLDSLHQGEFALQAPEDGVRLIERTSGSARVCIRLLNRDKLPGRVFGCPFRVGLIEHWEPEIRRRKSELKPALAPRLQKQISAEFVKAEYEQVILGLECFDKDTYLRVVRVGRGQALQAGDREIVWRLVTEPKLYTHQSRRLEAVKKFCPAIEAGRQVELGDPFDYVFVDEFQDFTPAELKLLARVPPDPNKFCIAGDESQALHLGTSYRRPAIKGRRWTPHKLSGSYRLPLRICEALKPLADDLEAAHSENRQDEPDTVLLRSRKAAVPGPRPIVVAGSERLSADIRQIAKAFEPNFPQSPRTREPILLIDGDRALGESLRTADVGPFTRGSPERFKGLEWPFVLISDKAAAPRSEAIDEWVFTALTRTSSVLVIVLWPDGRADLKRLFARLRFDRLLPWDESAERALKSCLTYVSNDRPPF